MAKHLQIIVGLLVAGMLSAISARAIGAGVALDGMQVLGNPNAPARGLIVLVPGTWNSLLPGNTLLNPISDVVEKNPYFSAAIVNTVLSKNYYYYVIKNLSPFGDVQFNAGIITQQISPWYNKYFPKHDMPVTLLAHSMGGAYVLAALKNLTSLPIRNIAFVSVPLDGAPLANAFLSNSLSKAVVNALYAAAGTLFDFRGLIEASTSQMRTLVKGTSLPANINYFVTGSYQAKPPTIFQAAESQYLNPLFTLATMYSSSPTDGVVPLTSATANTANQPMRALPLVGHLDHAEQVLDYRILAAFGETNVDFIRDQQILFYSQIISALP